MLKLDSEKEKSYRAFAKFCERNEVQEAKIMLFNGTILTYKSRRKTL